MLGPEDDRAGAALPARARRGACRGRSAFDGQATRAEPAPAADDRDPLRRRRGRLRRVAAAPRHRALPAQARPSSCWRTCPPPARVLDVGCGTGVLAARLAASGYEVVGARPSAGMLEVMRERAPAVEAVQGSGDRDAVRGRRVRPQPLGGDDAPHRRRRTTCAARSAEMVRVVRPGGRHPRLGPQPAQPVLALPDEAGAPGPGRRAADRPRGAAGRPRGRRRRAAVEVAQLGLVPDFTPRRLLGAAAALERAAERTPVLRDRCAHNVVLAEQALAPRQRVCGRDHEDAPAGRRRAGTLRSVTSKPGGSSRSSRPALLSRSWRSASARGPGRQARRWARGSTRKIVRPRAGGDRPVDRPGRPAAPESPTMNGCSRPAARAGTRGGLRQVDVEPGQRDRGQRRRVDDHVARAPTAPRSARPPPLVVGPGEVGSRASSAAPIAKPARTSAAQATPSGRARGGDERADRERQAGRGGVEVAGAEDVGAEGAVERLADRRREGEQHDQHDPRRHPAQALPPSRSPSAAIHAMPRRAPATAAISSAGHDQHAARSAPARLEAHVRDSRPPSSRART